jgi:hypothetical protein
MTRNLHQMASVPDNIVDYHPISDNNPVICWLWWPIPVEIQTDSDLAGRLWIYYGVRRQGKVQSRIAANAQILQALTIGKGLPLEH